MEEHGIRMQEEGVEVDADGRTQTEASFRSDIVISIDSVLFGRLANESHESNVSASRWQLLKRKDTEHAKVNLRFSLAKRPKSTSRV